MKRVIAIIAATALCFAVMAAGSPEATTTDANANASDADVTTDANSTSQDETSSTSPQTGDLLVPGLITVAAAGSTVAFVAKKKQA